MTDHTGDLLAAADELTDPRRHVEVISGWDHNRNRKVVRRVTTLPSLLDQLAEAVIPGEVYIESESSRPGFASRPPARLDAIDRLLAIDAGAARWVTSIGLAVRDTTAGNIRALVGVSGTLDSDTLSALVYEVSLWRTWAATVTGWQSPPWRPRVPCPVCDRLGLAADPARPAARRAAWTAARRGARPTAASACSPSTSAPRAREVPA